MNFATKYLLLAAVASGSTFALAGCGDDDDDDDLVAAVTVNLTLTEYEIAASVSTVSESPVRFNVTNDGTMEHEVLIVRTDLAEDALPTNADGSYDEGGTGTDVVDKVEDMEPSDTGEVTVDLSAGDYVLLCNEVMEGTSHYAEGMHTTFTVE